MTDLPKALKDELERMGDEWIQDRTIIGRAMVSSDGENKYIIAYLVVDHRKPTKRKRGKKAGSKPPPDLKKAYWCASHQLDLVYSLSKRQLDLKPIKETVIDEDAENFWVFLALSALNMNRVYSHTSSEYVCFDKRFDYESLHAVFEARLQLVKDNLGQSSKKEQMVIQEVKPEVEKSSAGEKSRLKEFLAGVPPTGKIMLHGDEGWSPYYLLKGAWVSEDHVTATQAYGFTISALHLHGTLVFYADTLVSDTDTKLIATFLDSESKDHCEGKILEFAQLMELELEDPDLFRPRKGALGLPVEDMSEDEAEDQVSEPDRKPVKSSNTGKKQNEGEAGDGISHESESGAGEETVLPNPPGVGESSDMDIEVDEEAEAVKGTAVEVGQDKETGVKATKETEVKATVVEIGEDKEPEVKATKETEVKATEENVVATAKETAAETDKDTAVNVVEDEGRASLKAKVLAKRIIKI